MYVCGVVLQHLVVVAWKRCNALSPFFGCQGVAIANDGTIEFRPGKRIGFSHLLTDRFVGEAVTVRVLRGGSDRLDLFVRLHVTLNDNRCGCDGVGCCSGLL